MASAQSDFMRLDWDELRIDSVLPVYAEVIPLESDYRSCDYSVSIRFPEWAPLTSAEAAVAVEAAEAVPAEAPVLTRKEKKQLKKAQKKEKRLQKKLAKKERKKRWKETKKEDRRKLKEHYKDAPWFVRVPRLALRPGLKVCFWLLVAAVVISIGVAIHMGSTYINYGLAYLHQYDEVTPEQIEEVCPYDTEGAERIAAYPDISPDETWTICIYMVGADLEDCYENDLSLTTRLQISDA